MAPPASVNTCVHLSNQRQRHIESRSESVDESIDFGTRQALIQVMERGAVPAGAGGSVVRLQTVELRANLLDLTQIRPASVHEEIGRNVDRIEIVSIEPAAFGPHTASCTGRGNSRAVVRVASLGLPNALPLTRGSARTTALRERDARERGPVPSGAAA